MNKSSVQNFLPIDPNNSNNILESLNNSKITRKRTHNESYLIDKSQKEGTVATFRPLSQVEELLKLSSGISKPKKRHKRDTNNKTSNTIITPLPGAKLSSKLYHRKSREASSFHSRILQTYENESCNNSKFSEKKGIIWTKEKVSEVWNKLVFVKNKIKEKKEEEYNFIKKAIEDNNDHFVLQWIKEPTFKKMFRNKDCLFPENAFIDVIIDNLKFDFLIEFLKEPSFVFQYDYIFEFIIKLLKEFLKVDDDISFCYQESKDNSIYNNDEDNDPRTKSRSKIVSGRSLSKESRNPKQKEILDNLIRYELYPKEDEKIRIIGWYLASFDYFEIFKNLLSTNHKCFESEKNHYAHFDSNEEISSYGKDTAQFQKTVENCLKNGYEDLAILLCKARDTMVEIKNLATFAAEYNCIQFLKYLWEKDHIEEDDFHHNTVMRGSNYKTTTSNFNDNKGKAKILTKGETIFKPSFEIKSVLKKLVSANTKDSTKLNFILNQVINWKNIEKDPDFIPHLFSNHLFEQISFLISKWPAEKFAHPDHFREVIKYKETELLLFFLKRRDCRIILTEPHIQDIIIKEYMGYGDRLYYGAEMLMYIYKNQWKGDTKELCKNIMKTIKKKDILNCHSSILTCLLLCEFLTQIKEISIINVSRCEKVMVELKEYCKTIQESNPQEAYISYLMKQKDTKERSAFHIASENSMYSLLETAEIGTIVKKMWDGTLSNNGFLVASSMHRFCVNSDSKPSDPFKSFETLDLKKVYFFQIAVWLDSCSLRFNPMGISTIIIVVIYNLFIYVMNVDGQLLNNFWELSFTLRILLSLYLMMVSSLVIDFFFKALFIYKTNRAFKMEIWAYIDFILFFLAWLILLDTKKFADEYSNTNLHHQFHAFIWNMGTSFTKELSNEVEQYSTSIAFITRVVILSLNDLLVWVRVCGILLTFKQMGPVIRMIISMAILLIRYIVIIALFLACCAAIFTAIFNRYSVIFFDFSTSIITLFGGFLNNFDVQNFDDKYKAFGSVLFMAYVCVSGVLLVNLLIAVLSNVYEELAKVVDASHRAVLIQYYRKYKWDNEYGYLIFLTPPLNLINFLVMLITVFPGVNKKKVNEISTKIYYTIFYFPFIIIAFFLYTILLIPISYIKGNIVMFNYQYPNKLPKILKAFSQCKWIFLGLFYLLYIYFRDIVYCISTVFKEVEEKTSDFKRIKKNITSQDVIIFLKFIHSDISIEDKKDIHSIFLAYLAFEESEKAQMKMNMISKKQKEYYKKLEVTRKKSKQMIYLNKDENENNTVNYSVLIRKNLMIIEVLENFVIDDEVGSTAVDIVKMRKLLPRTMNIKNCHYRRLINSDVHALNQAMAKLKISKNIFLQYQLVNKIMSSAQRLDKEIDSEILKIQRYKNSGYKREHAELKMLNKSSLDKKLHQTDEQSKQLELKKGELELMKSYESLIKNIDQTVIDIINAKKESHNSISSSYTNSITNSLISQSYQRETILSKQLSNSQTPNE